MLNKEPIYLKFALYQGYWTDTLWTAPSDEAIKRDLELLLEMGFNGVRLHQKVEGVVGQTLSLFRPYGSLAAPVGSKGNKARTRRSR